MNRIINFVRSELFLSLAGGFALGVAGLTVIKPASADIGHADTAQAVSVGAPFYDETNKAK